MYFFARTEPILIQSNRFIGTKYPEEGDDGIKPTRQDPGIHEPVLPLRMFNFLTCELNRIGFISFKAEAFFII